MTPSRDERINATARIEYFYKFDHPVTKGPPKYPIARYTYVDQEGYSVWCGTYEDLREDGLDHETAIRAVEQGMREASGLVPPVQPVTPTLTPLTGRLRIANSVFVDDTGPVLPTFCHFGEAFSAYIRRKPDVLLQLDEIAKAGYHGVRFWDVLGYYDAAWKGKEVTPIPFVNKSGQTVTATPGYYAALSDFLAICASKHLAVHHSRGDLNAWAWTDIITHCHKVRDVQRAVGTSVVALNESCNEAWQNGVDDPALLAEMGNALGDHALRALSCPPGASEEPLPLQNYSRSPADMFYVHGYRGGRSLDRIRHIFSLGYENATGKRLGWQGEPAGPGPGVTVGQENHPEALALMAAMSLLARQAWVYMSGHGVFWNGPIESQPGFREVAKVRSYLPADLMAYQTLFHGGASWHGARVLVANADGTLRCDHTMHKDGRFVAVVYGTPGSWAVPVERSFTGEAIHPVTLERQPLTLQAGQTWPVTFERGRVVVGRLT